MIGDDGIDSYFSNDSAFQVLGYVFGMPMPGVIWSDSLGSLEVVVDFPAVEDIEDELPSWMHKMLIDVVHIVIDDDVAHSLFFVCFEVLMLLQQLLVDFVVVLRVLVLVPEKEGEDDCSRLGSIYHFQDYEDDRQPRQEEQPSSKQEIVHARVHDQRRHYLS